MNYWGNSQHCAGHRDESVNGLTCSSLPVHQKLTGCLFGPESGRWSWNLTSSKECTTCHQWNRQVPKIDGVRACHWYLFLLFFGADVGASGCVVFLFNTFLEPDHLAKHLVTKMPDVLPTALKQQKD